jgi:hypothetical protein
MTFKIWTSKEAYYHQAVNILAGIPPYNRLTNNSKQLLIQFLIQRDLIEEQGVTEKHIAEMLLFSRKTKKEISRILEVKEPSIRNDLHKLRVVGLIKDGKLNVPASLKYKEDLVFHFEEKQL